MDKNFEGVLHDALNLDHESKVQLAERIAVDLAKEDDSLAEWIAESNRRFSDYKRGTETARDAREAINDIRRRLQGQ